MRGNGAEWKSSDCYRFAITHESKHTHIMGEEEEEDRVRVQQEHKLLDCIYAMLRDAKCQCFDMRMMTMTATKMHVLPQHEHAHTQTLTVSQLRMINNLLKSVCKCVRCTFLFPLHARLL